MRETARCYGRLARAGFLRWSAYRNALLAGLFTNCVFGFLRTGIVLTVFTASAHVGGYDRSAAITFVWLGQGLLAIVMITGGLDLGERIRTGDIAIDLARPVDFQLSGLAQEYGRALISLVYRSAGPLLIGLLVYRMRLPGSALTWCAFALSVVVAVAVSFAGRFMVALIGFWTLDTRGSDAFYGLLAGFCSGLVLPVGFFPHWLRVVTWCTPFPSILQVPIDIFVQRHSTGVTWLLVLAQLGWALVLLLAGRLMVRRARLRLVVQGG